MRLSRWCLIGNQATIGSFCKLWRNDAKGREVRAVPSRVPCEESQPRDRGMRVTAEGGDLPPFGKEDVYAKWKKEPNKRYFIFKYARDGDTLTLDCGDNDVFTKLMKNEKFKGDGGKYVEFYDTPPGWLAKYLDKTRPEKLFDKSNFLELKRDKK